MFTAFWHILINSMFEIAAETALVTAAGQGIGRAIAAALATAGAQVTASDINEQAFAKSDDLQGVTCITLDVTDDAQVAECFAELRPDILINVAGIVHHGTILDCDFKDWEVAMRLNARSVYVTCQAALPAMIDRGHGCIVNIASVAGSVRGVPLRFAYGASKATVIGITKSIAADFIKQGIRANAICPGTVHTPSWEGRVRDLAQRESITEDEARTRFAARQPMGRVGTAAEIAAMVVYLASPAGAFMSGQEICIDGGWTCL